MDSKLRLSLAVCLVPVVLSAMGAVQAADTALQAQPSCASTSLVESGDDVGADMFGASVAMSGQTALAKMPGFDSAFISPPVPPPYVVGRVAVFTCEASTQTWTRTASIQLPATEANQNIALGASVALQGNLAAIGAQYGVYLYKGQGQTWSPIAKIIPDNSHEGAPVELWGSVIALSDHVLAIGVTEITSPSSAVPRNYYVDIYQIITLGDRGAAFRIARLKPPAGDTGVFGAALALQGDTLVVGDPPDTTAYVYKRHGFTFELDQTLTAAEATTSSGFGTTVALSKGVILIGAPSEDPIFDWFGVASSGAVYAFRHESGPDSPWIETQHFNAMNSGPLAAFGGSLAVNRHGLAVIGTPSPYDFRDNEYGPTFFYTLQGGQFVLSTQSRGLEPATSLGITDEYLVTGFVANAGAGGSFSGVTIENLKD
jgi:FG-GAP repeat protein